MIMDHILYNSNSLEIMKVCVMAQDMVCLHVPCALEKNVRSAAVGCRVFYKSCRSRWFVMLFSSSVSSVISYVFPGLLRGVGVKVSNQNHEFVCSPFHFY